MYIFTGKIYLPNAISTQTHMLNQYIAISDYLMKHNLLKEYLYFLAFSINLVLHIILRKTKPVVRRLRQNWA